MAKQQPELGRKSPIRLRLGVDIDTFRGVNKENDPGAIHDTEFQDLVNARVLANGKVVGRGGQERIITDPMDGCVVDIVDDDPPYEPSASRLYYDVPGNLSHSRSVWGADSLDVHNFIGEVDMLEEYSRRFASYGGQLLVSRASTRAMESVNLETGETTVEFQELDDFIRAFAYFDFGDPEEGDKLIVAISDDATDKVKQWGGGGSVTEIGSGINGPDLLMPRLCTSENVHDDLFYANTDRLKRYNAGAWTNIALPGGLTKWQTRDLVDGGSLNRVFLCGYDDLATDVGKILSYDGATATVARTIANCTVVSAGAMLGSIFHYAWTHSGTGQVNIGRYDGSTWNDTYKNLTGDFAGIAGPVYRLYVFNSNLHAGLGGSGTHKLLRSHSGSVSGTWRSVHTDAGVVAGDMIAHTA